MEKTKVYQIETKTTEATSCDYCEDGVAEYSCYACERKLCFFCVKRVKGKFLCFFHWKLSQVFEKGGERE
jgi:hypothetical protein